MSINSLMNKIEKLLRVAEGDVNENESALALQMAQQLADAHNLDIDTIGKSGAREDESIRKGMYHYQRDLYRAVATINHCSCMVLPRVGRGKPTIRLVGSKLNVTTTKNLCSYIENVTNRLVKENYHYTKFLSKAAHYFREGMIERLLERIRTKREEEERAREALKRKQEEEQRKSGGDTNGNAIVLIKDVTLAEEKANYDYLHGEGAWDRLQAWRQERREAQKKADEEYERWKEENPEEYAKQEEEKQKEWEEYKKRLERNARNRERARQKRIDEFGYDPNDYRYRKPTKYDSDDYHNGRNQAESVALNDQIDKNGSAKGELK